MQCSDVTDGQTCRCCPSNGCASFEAMLCNSILFRNHYCKLLDFRSSFTSPSCAWKWNAAHFLFTHCTIATVVSLLYALENFPECWIINIQNIAVYIAGTFCNLVEELQRSMAFLAHSTFCIRPIVLCVFILMSLFISFPDTVAFSLQCSPHINALHNNQFFV